MQVSKKKFCIKILVCKHYFSLLTTFIRKSKDPDPYFWLMDPDPGGSKTCGSGSLPLLKRPTFEPTGTYKFPTVPTLNWGRWRWTCPGGGWGSPWSPPGAAGAYQTSPCTIHSCTVGYSDYVFFFFFKYRAPNFLGIYCRCKMLF